MQKLPSFSFTLEGYEKLKVEQEEMFETRKLAVADLKKARELGDLSENGYYKAARFKLTFVDRRLRELKMLIKYGKVVHATDKNTVSVSSTVTVSDGKGELTFHIVGSHEANPRENKLSDKSPIGRQLLGKKVGDIIPIEIPRGKISYTIISIT